MASGGVVYDVTKEIPANYRLSEIKPDNQDKLCDVPSPEHSDDSDENDVKVRLFRGHNDTVSSCQVLDNDTKVLSASHDLSLLLWKVDDTSHLKEYKDGHTKKITKARASPDCTRIVSTGWDKKVVMWDLETGNILWTRSHTGITMCCNFSHDGRHVISASDLDPCVKIWDAHNGDLIQEIKDIHTSTITSCQFSGTDERIITTSMDRTCKFYDLKSQRTTIDLKGHINVVSGAALSRDERKLATVSWDKSAQVWDVPTGMYRKDGPPVLQKAHEGSVSSCDISHDGSLLVTGGYDNRVCLWDVDQMVQLLKLQGHDDWVEDVCFSEDGQWILSASKDHTLRMWNVENRNKIPMAAENRGGPIVTACDGCGKPFSVTEIDSAEDAKYCVFCRHSTLNTLQASED